MTMANQEVVQSIGDFGKFAVPVDRNNTSFLLLFVGSTY